MDNDQKLAVFLDSLGEGADVEFAHQLLEAHGWNLEAALETVTSGAASVPPEPDAAVAAAPAPEGAVDADGYRAPMRTGYFERLIDSPQRAPPSERVERAAQGFARAREEEARMRAERRAAEAAAAAPPGGSSGAPGDARRVPHGVPARDEGIQDAIRSSALEHQRLSDHREQQALAAALEASQAEHLRQERQRLEDRPDQEREEQRLLAQVIEASYREQSAADEEFRRQLEAAASESAALAGLEAPRGGAAGPEVARAASAALDRPRPPSAGSASAAGDRHGSAPAQTGAGRRGADPLLPAPARSQARPLLPAARPPPGMPGSTADSRRASAARDAQQLPARGAAPRGSRSASARQPAAASGAPVRACLPQARALSPKLSTTSSVGAPASRASGGSRGSSGHNDGSSVPPRYQQPRPPAQPPLLAPQTPEGARPQGRRSPHGVSTVPFPAERHDALAARAAPARLGRDSLLRDGLQPVAVCGRGPATSPLPDGAGGAAPGQAAAARAAAEADARRRAEAEARRRREAEAAEAEARRRREAEAAEAEARRRREAEAAEAEARRRREAEAAEAEARRRREAEAAEAEARRRREAEAAEAEARRRREAEAAEAEASRQRAAAAAAASAELSRRREAEEKREAEQLQAERREAERREAERRQAEAPPERDADEVVQALVALRRLHLEADPGRLATCLQTLKAYIGNLARSPHETKFHRIRADNAAFRERVAALEGAPAVLRACGFAPEEGGAAWVVDPAFLRTKGPRLWDALAKVDVMLEQAGRKAA